MRTFLEPSRRALTPAEQRALRMRITALRAGERRSRRGTVLITAIVTVLLWGATLLASDSPWTLVTAFWAVAGTAIGLWSRYSQRTDSRHVVSGCESALRRNAADVYQVRARAFVDVEETEDEGALYAFDLGDGRVVWIAGQEFYEERRFPCLEFTLTYPLTETDTPAWMLIERRSEKATPSFTLPARFRERPDAPEHLEVWRAEWGRESDPIYFPTMCFASRLFSSQMLSISSVSGCSVQFSVTVHGFV
jgi:hypothetical protein